MILTIVREVSTDESTSGTLLGVGCASPVEVLGDFTSRQHGRMSGDHLMELLEYWKHHCAMSSLLQATDCIASIVEHCLMWIVERKDERLSRMYITRTSLRGGGDFQLHTRFSFSAAAASGWVLSGWPTTIPASQSQ